MIRARYWWKWIKVLWACARLDNPDQIVLVWSKSNCEDGVRRKIGLITMEEGDNLSQLADELRKWSLSLFPNVISASPSFSKRNKEDDHD